MGCSPISCSLFLWWVNSTQQSEAGLSSSGSQPWALYLCCACLPEDKVRYRAPHKQRWSWSSNHGLPLFQRVNPNQDIHGNWASTLCQRTLQVVPAAVSGKYGWWCGPSLNPYLTCLPVSLRWSLVSRLCGALVSNLWTRTWWICGSRYSAGQHRRNVNTEQL